MQVAMALPHEALVAARGEDALALRELAVGPRGEPLKRGRALPVRAERAQLIEVLPRLGSHVLGRAELAPRPGARDAGVKRRDLGGEVVHQRRIQLAAHGDAF